MLTKFIKLKVTKKIAVDQASLLIFFNLTHTNRETLETLKTIFQKYSLTLTRFKGLQFFDAFNSFADLFQNANFVAWSSQPLLHDNLILLNQLLNLKVIPLVFFYRGQIWTVSRLKKNSNQFLQPVSSLNLKSHSFNVFWKKFYQSSF